MPNDPNGFRTDARLAQPSCRVYNSAAITCTTSVVTTITFNSERFDPFGMHSTSANTERITFVVPGRYLVGASIEFAANATGQRAATIELNAVTAITSILMDATAGALTARFPLVALYDFVPGDYIRVVAFQNSGGDLTVTSAGNYSPEMWAQRVG